MNYDETIAQLERLAGTLFLLIASLGLTLSLLILLGLICRGAYLVWRIGWNLF